MKDIKEYINESTGTQNNLNEKDVYKISNELYESDEYSGFRKSISTEEIDINELQSSYTYSKEDDYKEFKDKVEKEAKSRKLNKIVIIDGDGYGGRWAMVAFFNTKPYEYMIYHSFCGCSELMSSKTETDAIDDILSFVE